MTIDVGPWPGLELGGRRGGGARSDVHAGVRADVAVVVRRSRRSAASLAWELDLMETLTDAGFVVPRTVPAADGRREVDGVVVQTWVPGRAPESADDWRRVADELIRLHRATVGHTQRPDCAAVPELRDARRSVDADLDTAPAEVAAKVLTVFEAMGDVDTAIVHGDPGAGNVRLLDDGRVGFLDWDECRVDLVWHDLSNLGVTVLTEAEQARAERLSHAWEAINGWTIEPEYARRRFDALD